MNNLNSFWTNKELQEIICDIDVRNIYIFHRKGEIPHSMSSSFFRFISCRIPSRGESDIHPSITQVILFKFCFFFFKLKFKFTQFFNNFKNFFKNFFFKSSFFAWEKLKRFRFPKTRLFARQVKIYSIEDEVEQPVYMNLDTLYHSVRNRFLNSSPYDFSDFPIDLSFSPSPYFCSTYDYRPIVLWNTQWCLVFSDMHLPVIQEMFLQNTLQVLEPAHFRHMTISDYTAHVMANSKTAQNAYRRLTEEKSQSRLQSKVDGFLGFHYPLFNNPERQDTCMENNRPYSSQFWNAIREYVEEPAEEYLRPLDRKPHNDISVSPDIKGLKTKQKDQDAGKIIPHQQKDTSLENVHPLSIEFWKDLTRCIKDPLHYDLSWLENRTTNDFLYTHDTKGLKSKPKDQASGKAKPKTSKLADQDTTYDLVKSKPFEGHPYLYVKVSKPSSTSALWSEKNKQKDQGRKNSYGAGKGATHIRKHSGLFREYS